MRQDSKDLLVVIPAVALFAVAGIAMIYFGNYIYRDIQSVRKHGISVQGTILRYERYDGPKVNETIVVPVVEFRALSGENIVFEGNVDSASLLQNLCYSGEQVEVIYDPLNPGHAVINTFAEIWFGPLLLWLIGCGFLLGPPFTIYRHYRYKQ